jgi:hypothetical protein
VARRQRDVLLVDLVDHAVNIAEGEPVQASYTATQERDGALRDRSRGDPDSTPTSLTEHDRACSGVIPTHDPICTQPSGSRLLVGDSEGRPETIVGNRTRDRVRSGYSDRGVLRGVVRVAVPTHMEEEPWR